MTRRVFDPMQSGSRLGWMNSLFDRVPTVADELKAVDWPDTIPAPDVRETSFDEFVAAGGMTGARP